MLNLAVYNAWNFVTHELPRLNIDIRPTWHVYLFL